MTYTQTHDRMTLCALTQEQHERTCGYWYTVTTYGATPHTAFRTRAHALRWLAARGLTIEGELPEPGTHGVFPITGSYRRSSHMDGFAFAEIEGFRVLCLDNARYTLGVITQDEDGLRTLHHLNCNVDRPDFDPWKARIAEDWHIAAERAQDIRRSAAQWPYFGNLSRFMTEDEAQQIDALWTVASDINGNLSRASIVDRIARGADPFHGEVVHADLVREYGE